MRLRIHFVAVLLMALLAAEPAVAGLYCSMDQAGGSMCAQMAEMGADCPMQGQTSLEACAPDCCNQAQPSSTVAMTATSAKPRLMVAAPVDTAALLPAKSRIASFGFEPQVLSSSPPRHILLRVFRI